MQSVTYPNIGANQLNNYQQVQSQPPEYSQYYHYPQPYENSQVLPVPSAPAAADVHINIVRPDVSVLDTWRTAIRVTIGRISPLLRRFLREQIPRLFRKYIEFTTEYGTPIGFAVGALSIKLSPSTQVSPVIPLAAGLLFGKVCGPYVLPTAFSYFFFKRREGCKYFK